MSEHTALEFRETPTPECRCPFCGYVLTAAMAADPGQPDATPSPGDLTICLSCVSVLVFVDDLTVVVLPPDELKKTLACNPGLAAVMRRAQRAVRSIDRRGLSNG